MLKVWTELGWMPPRAPNGSMVIEQVPGPDDVPDT